MSRGHWKEADDECKTPNLPNFLKQVEAILAWRAAVPLEDRFWRSD
jgi:hypothetical protein